MIRFPGRVVPLDIHLNWADDHTEKREKETPMAKTPTTAEDRAERRTNQYTGMLWHIATFVIINGFLWVLDIATGGGVTWASWITLFWGIGLLFHIAWYFIDVRGSGSRYDKALSDERLKDA